MPPASHKTLPAHACHRAECILQFDLDSMGVQGFYDGIYYAPLYSAHHLICCNLGFFITDEDDDKVSPDTLHQRLYHELLSLLPHDSRPIANVLEVGCGPGGGLAAIHSYLDTDIHLVGVDISSQALARAKDVWQQHLSKHKTSSAPSFRPLHTSCEKMLSVPSSSVDLLTTVQTLHEVDRLQLAIGEFLRVLRPGGILLLADLVPSTSDTVEEELLSLARSDPSVAGFDILHERRVGKDVARACAASSSTMTTLIEQLFPLEFQDEMKKVFFVRGSETYRRLEAGEMDYRLVCLRRRPQGQTDEYQEDDSSFWDATASEDDINNIQDDDLPNYYDYQSIFPALRLLQDHFETILDEMKAVEKTATWPFWPESHYMDEDSEWRVFPLCYTFPAWDASKTTWVPTTCDRCPRTVELLRQLPGIRTALFSKLGPGTTLGAHRGWADLSNHILRCHLPLDVPTVDGEDCCAMVVGNDGEKKYHKTNEVLVFDDSKLHYAFNSHPTENRTILIVDLYRPEELPRGRAKGGHTDALDEFIQAFGQSMGV